MSSCLSQKMRNVYVQFTAQGFYGMRIEAVGNEFLEPSDQLIKDDVQKLLKIGWHSPTYKRSKADPEPPVGSCNYYIDVDKPVPYSKLAAIATRTLQQVYCTRHPGYLQYNAIGPNYSVRFPTLGLKREVPMDKTESHFDEFALDEGDVIITKKGKLEVKEPIAKVLKSKKAKVKK